jgi:Domain of unknown function (DUF927)
VDARGFLQHVVPWELGGYVTIHWHRPEIKGFFGRSCQSIDDAMALVANLKATTQHNIYFCVSRQELNNGQRDRAHAIGLVCIPMDLDVKPDSPKHYPTTAEAIASLFWFCDSVGIPRPSLLVASGGGLHAYWLSDRVLTVAEWQPYADAIKATARAAGLKFDGTGTGDAARVLRVPNTYNWKYDVPRAVRLIQPYCTGAKIDFAEAFKKILGKSHTPHTIAPAFKHLPVTPLAEGIVLRDIPPLPVAPILNECGWLREAYETGGREFDNPQWNLTTLIATFLENGHALAHKFGDQHPTYVPDKTDELWDRKNRERRAANIGWPRCNTIAGAGSTHCASCRHLVRDKSPINIGYEAFASPVDETLKELGGTRPPEARLPEGYCFDEEGRVCAIQRAKKVKGGGIQPARLVVLLLTQISSPSLQLKEGKFGLGFIAKTDRYGTSEVFLHSGNCFKDGGLFRHLAEKCVLYNTDDGARKMIEKFAVSWLDKLLKADTAIRDSGTMGWRYEQGVRIGFVYGNTLFHENGSEVPLIASADNDFRSWYTPVGKREAWFAAAKLLTTRKRPELDVIIAVGFAAPLMTFAGTLYGAILSVWGHPGTAKSTAQQIAAAIWGHPKQTRESLNSTPKSVQGRLGRCRNLAAFWDDIQDERHQDALFETMFVATQGAEGGRLNTDASMKARLEWQTLLVACSNASFVEYLTLKQKSTTAGMRRVFEIEFNKQDNEPGMINATDAGRVFSALEQNYGGVGVEYAKILAKEHKEIDLMVAEVTKTFCEKVEGTGDEAYWWGSCGVLLAGAMLANRLGAELDVAAMDTLLQTAFHHNRTIRGTEGTEGGSYQNTENALTSFLNHYVGSGNVLVVERFFEIRHKPVKLLRTPIAGKPIVVQIARDQRKIVFSKREMREFLHKKEIQSRQVFNGLASYFKAKEVRHTLGAGTAYAQGQEFCVEIFIPADRPHILTEMLESQGQPVSVP